MSAGPAPVPQVRVRSLGAHLGLTLKVPASAACDVCEGGSQIPNLGTRHNSAPFLLDPALSLAII